MRQCPKAVVSSYSNFPCFLFPVLPPQRAGAASCLPSLPRPSLSLQQPELGFPDSLAKLTCFSMSTVALLASPFLIKPVTSLRTSPAGASGLAIFDSSLAPLSRNPIRACTLISLWSGQASPPHPPCCSHPSPGFIQHISRELFQELPQSCFLSISTSSSTLHTAKPRLKTNGHRITDFLRNGFLSPCLKNYTQASLT